MRYYKSNLDMNKVMSRKWNNKLKAGFRNSEKIENAAIVTYFNCLKANQRLRVFFLSSLIQILSLIKDKTSLTRVGSLLFPRSSGHQLKSQQ